METTTKKWKTEKLKSKKTDMLRSIVGEFVESVLKKKRKTTVEGFAEKEGFKPGMTNYRGRCTRWWFWGCGCPADEGGGANVRLRRRPT